MNKKKGFSDWVKKNKTKIIIIGILAIIIIVLFILGSLNGGSELRYIPV
jgi:hypothetical protein